MPTSTKAKAKAQSSTESIASDMGEITKLAGQTVWYKAKVIAATPAVRTTVKVGFAALIIGGIVAAAHTAYNYTTA